MGTTNRFKGREWRYFILNGELNRILQVNRGQDYVTAWNYPQRCRMAYPKSVIMKYGEQAIRLSDAAEILGRHRVTLARYHREGILPIPHKTYSLRKKNVDSDPHGRIFYGKSDILRAHTILANVHQGRPRKDGEITCQTLPTKGELKAELDYDLRLYARTKDGNLVRVWEADKVDWS